MNINLKSLMLVTLSLSVFNLIGCGGSTGTDADTPRDSASVRGEVDEDAPLELISGVYDVSRENDETYLYIDDEGNVIAYDYQGDSSGTSENCYSIPSSISQANFQLTSGIITYTESAEVYTLLAGPNTLVFTFDSDLGMRNFRFITAEAIYQSGIGLNIQIEGVNISVGGSGSLPTNSPSISDIKGMICT